MMGMPPSLKMLITAVLTAILVVCTGRSALAWSLGLASTPTTSIAKSEPVLQLQPSKINTGVLQVQLMPDPPPVPLEPDDYRLQLVNGPPGMNRIGAPEAWSFHTGSYATVVAVVDTGVDYTHEDLYRNIWINQGEIPGYPDGGIFGRLIDIDGDGLITFHDLNDAANQGPYTIQDRNGNGVIDGGDLLFKTYCQDAPLPPAKDLDGDGIPENQEPGSIPEPDCSGAGGWADGADGDANGYVDDLIGWDFKGNDNDPFDVRGHGTEVAGVIGAIGNNARGVAGLNWRTRIMAVRTPFVDELVDPSDNLATGLKMLDELWHRDVIDAAARGLRYAVDNGAELSNLSRADFLHPKFKQWAQDAILIGTAASFLGPPFTGLAALGAVALGIAIDDKLDRYFDSMKDAVRHARDFGHILVAASGNGNYDADDPLNTLDGPGDDIDRVPFYPASFDFDNIVAVTSTQMADDNRAYMANFGRKRVDLGAPESAISTTPPHIDPDGYRRVEGTSIAAPYVAGVATLLWDMHPAWTYDQVIAQIFAGVDAVADLASQTATGGRLNALGALAPGSWVTQASILGSPRQGGGFSSANGARITFNQRIRPATFTASDVKLWDTTTGSDVAVPVTEVVALSDRSFEIGFATITGAEHGAGEGFYRLEIGPQIRNYDDRRMDLDRNGISGEAVVDRVSMAFRVKLELPDVDGDIADKPGMLSP